MMEKTEKGFATIDQTDIRVLDSAAQLFVGSLPPSLSLDPSEIRRPVGSVRGFCTRLDTSSVRCITPGWVCGPCSGYLTDHRSPDEPGQLSADRGDGELRSLAAQQQVQGLAVQPPAGAVDVVDDSRIHSSTPLDQDAAGGMVTSVVPGGLHQESSQMAVARLGDPALAAFVAAGVLRGDQAKEGHELRRGGKSAEVTDFGDEGQRDEGLDSLEGAERPHRLTVTVPLGDPLHLGGQLGTGAFQFLQSSQVAVEGLTVKRATQIQGRQLVPMLHRPGASLLIADAPPKKQVQDALLALTQIVAHVFAHAQVVAHRLVLFGGDMHGGELSCP